MSNLINYHAFTTNATLNNGLEVELVFMIFPHNDGTHSQDTMFIIKHDNEEVDVWDNSDFIFNVFNKLRATTLTNKYLTENGVPVDIDFVDSRDILLEMYETFMNFVRKLSV